MRLKSAIWVKAYLRRCATYGAFATVLRHGDDDAGAIFIRIVRLDRCCAIFAPAPSGFDGGELGRSFVATRNGAFVSETEADQVLKRETEFDADVWIVEVEDRDGRHFLGPELIVDKSLG